ncbi:MAG: aminoglycoside phosphotransferase family protein [Chloroflexota bacterium]
MKALLTHLADFPANGRFHTWQIQQIEGGANNKLYRATNDEQDLAQDWVVKFTIRDQRRRAWREYHALLALHKAGLMLAPQPLLLDETSFSQPVVVQTWVDGEVTAVPPRTDAEWEALVQHYIAIHQLTPDKSAVELQPAVLNFNGTESAFRQIEAQITAVPADHSPPILNKLCHHLMAMAPSLPPASSLALCRVDPNSLNFVRRSPRWLSVDWENSGWGDPTCELADLLAHPKYLNVAAERQAWVLRRYGELCGMETAVQRSQLYYTFHLVWWVARASRMLYETPRDLDQRLAPPAPGWKQHLERLLQRYIELAETAVFQNHHFSI